MTDSSLIYLILSTYYNLLLFFHHFGMIFPLSKGK